MFHPGYTRGGVVPRRPFFSSYGEEKWPPYAVQPKLDCKAHTTYVRCFCFSLCRRHREKWTSFTPRKASSPRTSQSKDWEPLRLSVSNKGFPVDRGNPNAMSSSNFLDPSLRGVKQMGVRCTSFSLSWKRQRVTQRMYVVDFFYPPYGGSNKGFPVQGLGTPALSSPTLLDWIGGPQRMYVVDFFYPPYGG